MLAFILKQFGLNYQHCTVQQFDSGLINKTWKIQTQYKSYILQKINNHIFKKPRDIDENLCMLKHYLLEQFPDYLFVAPIASLNGETLITTTDGYFRLFNFVEGSHTINYVKTPGEAFEAARQFGKFSRLLSGFDAEKLAYPLPNFHNLNLRYTQFIEACTNASISRLNQAKECINFIEAHHDILNTFNQIKNNKLIHNRVVHHDTKISNVLFNDSDKGLCVIDLDTVMPGIYISDVGDMVRTYLSPANEEEADLSKIFIRKDFFKAIYKGYYSEMGSALTKAEKDLFIYSGHFIIYMQAIRFLSDFLNNDIYYGAKYLNHNLNRANNQITLLKEYLAVNEDLEAIIQNTEEELKDSNLFKIK
ncbi:MAG: aminoglycoside phosphotransferase family protein [Flavobacterium sp.]|nr:aminoglycoside phosphotransferase family protein [Pedobacter sp.]